MLLDVGVTPQARAEVTIEPTRAVPFDRSDTRHYVVVEYELTNTGDTFRYDPWMVQLLVGNAKSDAGMHPLVLGFYCRKMGCNPDQFKLFVTSVPPGAKLQSIAIFEVPSIPSQATLLLTTATGDTTRRISLRRVGDAYETTPVPKKGKK